MQPAAAHKDGPISLCLLFPLHNINQHCAEILAHLKQGVYLDEHFDACDALEGQQQEGHEGEPLALR